MKTQQHMGIIWTIYFIIVIILLGSSASVSSDEGKTTEEVLLSQLVDPTSGEIDSYMAEILWLNCKTDLIKLKEVTEEFDLCLAEKTSCATNKINVKCWSMGKENIHKIISLLHPEVKQNLLDCLRKNNMLFRVFEEEGGSKVWYARYAEYIFPKAASRRNLGTKPLHWVTKVSAPAQSNNNAVIIAVVVTACITFIMAALLFLCCSRFFGGGSKMGRNDENPLLSLSMSDFSVGSFARGISIKEEKVGHQSFGNNSSHHRKASSLDGDFNTEFDGPRASLNGTPLGDMSTHSNAQVLPPTGGVTTSIGLPPLKPPPGKAHPLPLEPRSSFEAPPSKTSPPPPPLPPAPFPYTKPSSIASPFSSGPPPPPPPIAFGNIPGPCPPPPRPPPCLPLGSVPPPQPPPAALIGSKFGRAPPPAPRHPSNCSRGADDGPKTKLKPFFWDKVLANPDQTMVWHQLKAGSFQFDENMIESLFGCAATDKNKNEKKKEKAPEAQPQFIQIIDSKKSQNLSILLRALNVTIEEVCDALEEGNELPSEFLQTLLKMAPTPEEELKFRMFNGQLSQLGPADRFLKALVDIPFAFKRLEALLFMCTVQEEIAATEESFATLEIACKELRNSRLFLKLLEAVLKTGNRMNDGTFRGGAQAFKLDTLLKLSDVKGTDGKTTLLHFVVLEIIRSEGVRAARMAKENKSFSSIKTEDLLQDTLHETDEHYRSLGLEVVSQLGNDLENVKKAANLDADCLVGTVAKISHGLQKSKEFLNFDMKNVEEDNGFHQALKSFVEDAEGDIIQLLVEEKRIMVLVKSTGDYFHGNAGKDEGLRLFNVVRDFLLMLERACREVREAQKKQTKTH